MKTILSVAWLAACSVAILSGQVLAQETVAPSPVFAQVNRDLDQFKTLETLYEPKPGMQPFTVKAWFAEGVFRRVKASQTGDGGVLTRDFYYATDGELRFALVTLAEPATAGNPGFLVEERFDFEHGVLLRYVGADKKPVSKEDKNFSEMETALLAMSADLVKRIEASTAYAGMIGGVNDKDKTKSAAGTIFGAGYSDGVFSDIEQGDFFHLDLQQADHKSETFVVLKEEPSVAPFLNDPVKSKGMKIRVHWVEKMQPLPDGAGSERLKICERIELLK